MRLKAKKIHFKIQKRHSKVSSEKKIFPLSTFHVRLHPGTEHVRRRMQLVFDIINSKIASPIHKAYLICRIRSFTLTNTISFCVVVVKANKFHNSNCRAAKQAACEVYINILYRVVDFGILVFCNPFMRDSYNIKGLSSGMKKKLSLKEVALYGKSLTVRVYFEAKHFDTDVLVE